MSNVTFAKSLDAFVQAEKKGSGAFGSLVEFAHSVVSALTGDIPKQLAASVKAEEASYKVAHPKMDSFPVAYRSSKSVIMSAVKAGVSLVGEDGKYRGKSELEKLTKEAAGESSKTPVEKFGIAINTATAVFAQCESLEDILSCKALLSVLAAEIVKAESAAKAA